MTYPLMNGRSLHATQPNNSKRPANTTQRAKPWLSFGLSVVDNDLPELNGLELVQRVRKISHRRRTPIIMLSASDCEREAWRAGVDEFLKKPEQISELPATIARLLKDAAKHV